MGVRICNPAADASIEAAPSSSTRSAPVAVVRCGRLVHVAPEDRPSDPAARETRVEDRPLVTRLHDKLYGVHREPHVHAVLRSASRASGGRLDAQQLAAALDTLHAGLSEEDRQRLVERLAPPGQGDGRVHYLDLLRWIEAPQPLGDEATALARGSSVPGPPTVRRGGGGHGVRDGGQSYWKWSRHNQQRVPGLLEEVAEGTYEQAQSDALLTGLLSAKLNQYRDKLRIIFRQMDANRNSLIDREEFVRGIAKLRINVTRAQAERLFELCDTDRSGCVDYEEFVDRFEEHGLAKQAEEQAKRRLRAAGPDNSATALAAATAAAAAGDGGAAAATPAEAAAAAARHPLVHELSRAVYGKGAAAAAIFKRADLTRSGYLGLADMTRCCQQLVPGIGQAQVAALMAGADPTPGGAVDYRAFVGRLLEAGVGHPRLLHSAPASGERAAWGGGTLGRFGEPLTAVDTMPHARALSAAGLSRPAASLAPPPPGAPGAGVAAPPPRNAPSAAERSSLDDLHARCVEPYLDSVQRLNASADISAWGGGGGGGDGAAATLPSVTSRSVDLGVLGRTGAAAQRAQTAEGGSRPPSHATARFSRFWSKRFADTTALTAPQAGCAAATGREGTWVRKDEGGAYLGFQSADKEALARRREQQRERAAASAAVDARYSAADDASGANDGRLEVARAARQRFEERAELYDRVRQGNGDASTFTFFARLGPFFEHTSDAANTPHRAYW